MRIVSGRFGGRRLVAPRGRGIRPTLERVREAIFDVLQSRVEGSRVLDLFAGSGALGLEALSRGAARAVFVDADSRALDALRENARRLGLRMDPDQVLHLPALQAISRLHQRGESFDLIFLDPPWEGGFYDETLLSLSLAPRLAAPGAFVVGEHSRRLDVSPVYGALRKDRERQYGDTRVSYFRCQEASG